jgi:hypothetical protein
MPGDTESRLETPVRHTPLDFCLSGKPASRPGNYPAGPDSETDFLFKLSSPKQTVPLRLIGKNTNLFTSVADPDPPVFGPPGSGSGSNSQRYGSGSFYH